jgi:hypothetical protein
MGPEVAPEGQMTLETLDTWRECGLLRIDGFARIGHASAAVKRARAIDGLRLRRGAHRKVHL